LTHSEGTSKRKKTGKELKDSGKEFRALFNLMPDLVAIVDGRGKILAVNDAAEKVGGFKRKELVGKNFLSTNVFTPESKAITVENLAKRMTGAQIAPYEVEMLTKYGEKRSAELNATRIEYKGKLANLVVFRDITESRKAEEQLRETSAKLQTLVNAIPDVVYFKDAQGRNIVVNKAFERLVGLSQSEIMGKTDEQLLPPDLAENFRKSDEEAIRGRKTIRVEEQTTHGDETVTFETIKAPIYNEQGDYAGLVGVSRDITDRKQMEDTLKESEERHRTYIEQASDLIFTLDASGKITSVNRAVRETTGYTAQELLGRSPLEFAAPESQAVAETAMGKILRGEEVERLEAEILSKDGRRILLEIRGRVLRENGRVVGAFHIARNITERRRAEQKLKALHRHANALASANKLEEVVNHTLDAMEFTLGFDLAGILAVEKGALIVKGWRGGELQILELPLEGPGMTVKAANMKKTVVVKDARKEPAYVDNVVFTVRGERQPMLSELAVPVLVHGETVAVLNVESSQPDAFTNEDQYLLETLAMHVASALERLKQVDTLESLVNERTRRLRESEEKYRLLVDNMMDTVFSIDLKGNFTFCSQAVEKMTGYSVQQMLSMNMKELVAPEHFQEILERLQARIRGEEYLPTHQFEIIRADGKRLPVEMTTTRVVENSTLIGIQGIARDITERKRAEEALRTSEEKYRTLVENANDFIHMIDEKGKVISLNRSAAGLFGKPAKELEGKSIFELFPNEIASRFSENLRKTFETDSGKTFEARMIAHGKEFWVSSSLNPVKDREGKVVAILGVTRDISERRKAENDLRESEEKFRRIYDASLEAVYTTSVDGEILDMNPAGVSMFGFDSLDELKKVKSKNLYVNPDDRKSLIELAVKGPVRNFDVLLKRKDGATINCIINCYALKDEEGKIVGLQGAIIDITELRQMEKKLREAERLAAIGETTAMVGHDLRNPLTGITGAVYILKTISNMKEDSKAKEFLDLIERNVEYSDKIINDLLDYSAELRLNLTTTNPKSIITDALRFIAIPGNIQVKDLSRNGTQLIADAEKLRRVALNLITNAVDAMPEGGTLTISSRQSNCDVEIAFSDTGIGMTKETMEKFGTPLLTTKAKGMGFGLAIVKRIVEAHGGSVFAETTAGRGSTFRVKLPIEPELKEVNKR